MCFSPPLGGGGGGGGLPRGLGHDLLMQFYSLGSSKMEISETDFFFDILTMHDDQISYVMHVLAPLYVFFTLFRGGGVPMGGAGETTWTLILVEFWDCMAFAFRAWPRVCHSAWGFTISEGRSSGLGRPAHQLSSVCLNGMLNS